MIKLSFAVILIIVSTVITIRTRIRNRASKKKGQQIVEQLKTHQLEITEFVKAYQFKFNTLKTEPGKELPEERKLEGMFSASSKLGKFEIMFYRKIRKGEYLFVTRSYIADYVDSGVSTEFGGRSGTSEIKHYDTYVFVLKIKPEGYDILSDVPESNEGKFVRMDFSKLLFAEIRKIS